MVRFRALDHHLHLDKGPSFRFLALHRMQSIFIIKTWATNSVRFIVNTLSLICIFDGDWLM